MRKCKSKTVHCSFNSPSNGSGSTTENFDEKDEDYVNSSVVEAVEVRNGADVNMDFGLVCCSLKSLPRLMRFVDGFFEQVVVAEGGGRKGEKMWFTPSRSRLKTYTSEHLRSSRSLAMYFAQSAMGKYNHIKISSYR
ncbi:hypothetical protein S83_070693, partial [Arachis hypogaea]